MGSMLETDLGLVAAGSIGLVHVGFEVRWRVRAQLVEQVHDLPVQLLNLLLYLKGHDRWLFVGRCYFLILQLLGYPFLHKNNSDSWAQGDRALSLSLSLSLHLSFLDKCL